VITVTLNPTVDKTCRVAALIPERKLDVQDLRSYPGGGGINVARVATRLGLRPRALWSAGGASGEFLEQLLREERLEQEPIPIAGATRENLIVFDAASEQHYRFGMPGPHLDRGDLERWNAAVEALAPQPGYLVVSGSLPPGATGEWFAEWLGRVPRDYRVIVDTKGAALRLATERGAFLVKPNLHELSELCGTDLEGRSSVERAARQLIGRGRLEAVLVSLGRGGALLVTATQSQCLPSPPVPLRSKVGAGDSMVGGLVTALARGWSLWEAARFGVAAGAAAVMTAGTELCRPEDVERLYERVREENATDQASR
jgi:6-phosphofructokinase 2